MLSCQEQSAASLDKLADHQSQAPARGCHELCFDPGLDYSSMDCQTSSLTLGLSNAEDAVQYGSDWALWSLALF